MEQSANLNLPYIMPSQAQKHVTHNEALVRLDALVQLAVLDRDLATPPGSPAPGDRYIVPSGATGTWDGWDHSIAVYADNAWLELPPRQGWIAWVIDEGAMLSWDGAAWQPVGDATAADVAFVPAGSVAAANVQDAIEEIDAEKLATSGGTLSGGLTFEMSGGVSVTSNVEGAGNPLQATKWINGVGGPVFVGRKARGTVASPAAVQSGDTLIGFRAYGWNNTGSDGFVDASRGAAFLIESAENWTTVATGTQIRFFVTPNGNGSLQNASEHTRLANDGSLQMGGANTVITASRHPQLRSYTVAGLPSASPPGQLIYVSDGTSNKRLGISDGTNWRFPDGSVVSD